MYDISDGIESLQENLIDIRSQDFFPWEFE